MRVCGLFQGHILQYGQQQVLESWGRDCSFVQLLCLSPEGTKRPLWSCPAPPRVSPTLPPVGSGAVMVWYHHTGQCHLGKDMACAMVVPISHLNGSPHSVLIFCCELSMLLLSFEIYAAPREMEMSSAPAYVSPAFLSLVRREGSIVLSWPQ